MSRHHGGPQRGRQHDMNELMQQAAAMQAEMQQRQAELASREFTGSAGGGVVSATVTGDGRLVSVSIDPAVLDPDDAEMVGDLVVAAVNNAMQEMSKAASETLGDLDLGGLDLGGLLG